ncbi:phosphatidylinositol-3,4-bisphosphate 4-phosphatase [Aureococcus anophagefferens]|nr:phosphatidylinositol-3,4-bisphosphate 4-phosphatase [Aureococcus anophagefferens]
MGSNDDDDVDGGVRFVLTQQDFQLILICIVRVGVAAACVLRLVGDFHESRSDGRTRMDAALMMTRRHGAVPLVLYLFVDTLGSFLENFEALLELRLILLGLWAGRVMVTRALLLDPMGREARIDALEALAPFLRVVALAGGVASPCSVARSGAAVASRGVLCVLDGSALLGAAFVAALAARMLVPVRRALQAEKKNEAEIAAAKAAVAARDLAGVEADGRAGALACASLISQKRSLVRLLGFAVLAAAAAAGLLEFHLAEALGFARPGRELDRIDGPREGAFQYLYAVAELALPVYWILLMQPLFARHGAPPPGPAKRDDDVEADKARRWARWAPSGRSGDFCGAELAPPDEVHNPAHDRDSSRDTDVELVAPRASRSSGLRMPTRQPSELRRKGTVVELRARPRQELFLLDELAGSPVAALFAGRDSFVVAYERRRKLGDAGDGAVWRELALELGFALGNLAASDTARSPEPEWSGYSDGEHHRDCPPVFMEEERVEDHRVVGRAFVGCRELLAAATRGDGAFDPKRDGLPTIWRPRWRVRAQRPSRRLSVPAACLRELSGCRRHDATILAARLKAHRAKLGVQNAFSNAKRLEVAVQWLAKITQKMQSAASTYSRLAEGYEAGALCDADGGQPVQNFKASTLKKSAALAFVPINLHIQLFVVDPNDEARTPTVDAIATCGAFAAHASKFKRGGVAQLKRDFGAAAAEAGRARRGRQGGGGQGLGGPEGRGRGGGVHDRRRRGAAADAPRPASARKAGGPARTAPDPVRPAVVERPSDHYERPSDVYAAAAAADVDRPSDLDRERSSERHRELRERRRRRPGGDTPPPPRASRGGRRGSAFSLFSGAGPDTPVSTPGNETFKTRPDTPRQQSNLTKMLRRHTNVFLGQSPFAAAVRDGRDAWPMDLAEVPLDGKLIELDCAIQLRLDQVGAVDQLDRCGLVLVGHAPGEPKAPPRVSLAGPRRNDATLYLSVDGRILDVMGINEMQSIANTGVSGDPAFQEDINRAALGRLEKHVEDVVLYFDGDFDDGRSSGLDRRPADFESRGNDEWRDDLRALAGKRRNIPRARRSSRAFGREKSSPARSVGLDGTLEQLQDDLEDLKDLVARSLHASRKHWQNIVGGEVVAKKHWQILVAAADLVRAAGGVRVTSCKSGKDRTGMSVTFEQVRLARKHLDCGDDDVDRVLYLSRLHGTRLENARKNTGRPVFAFNLPGRHAPAVYRPPLAVANKAVAS